MCLIIVAALAGLMLSVIHGLFVAMATAILGWVALAAHAYLQREDGPHPIARMVTPGVVLLLCSAGTALLFSASQGSLQVAYMELKGLEVAGFAAGLLMAQLVVIRRSRAADQSGWLGRDGLARYAVALLGLSLMAALAVGLKYGFPITMRELESSRADLPSGSGYLRTAAYLAVPASLIGTQVFVSLRWRVVAVVWAVVCIALLANRSPLVYLLLPLVVAAGLRPRIERRIGAAIVATAVLLPLLVAAGGAYRVFHSQTLRSYPEYSKDVARGDYLGVATTATGHYARVVGENALTARAVIDEGKLARQYGRTYLSPLTTALPGRQLTLDLELKRVAGAKFPGGGIPPTLAGEGYVNFGRIGVMATAAILAFGLALAWNFLLGAVGGARGARALFYGFLVTWTVMAQVAGLDGASPLPVIFLVVLLPLIRIPDSMEITRG